MRKMTNDDGSITLNITQHIILKNLWEYYVTDQKFNDHIIECLVVGNFTEIGDVDMNEIKPYIISTADPFEDLLPAPGWKWQD